MGDLQHFCLRWNNYQSSITSAFENLRDDEDFVDVTLACDGKSLKAHRVVLSACSPYFRELLKSTPCKHPVIVLQDVIFEDLHALVEFIYHGEVNVHQKALPSFLKTAEVLRVSGLTQQSEAKEEAGEKVREGPEESWLAYRRTPTSSQPQYRHRERRPSNSENTDTQESNSVPSKKIRTESSSAHNEQNQHPQNNHQQDKDDSEPPVDFSKVKKLDGDSSSPGPGRERDREREGREENHPHPPVKSEPVEAGGGGEPDDSNESAVISEPQIVTTEHDDSIPSGPHQNYFDSKLFAVAGASFNFSMAAALAADSLAGLNNQGHVGSGNELVPAGTSQGLRKVFTCLACGKVLCSKASLKRHVADKHASRHEEYRCAICERVYCSRNSLMTHIYTYHKPKPSDHLHHHSAAATAAAAFTDIMYNPDIKPQGW